MQPVVLGLCPKRKNHPLCGWIFIFYIPFCFLQRASVVHDAIEQVNHFVGRFVKVARDPFAEQAEHAVGVKAALIPFKLRCVVLRHHDDAERIIYAGLQSRGVKRFQQIAVVVIEYEKVP